MIRRRFRWLRGLLLAVPVVLLAALGTGWYLLAGSRAQLDGRVRTSGVQAPVEIQRDALGTVTLTGKSRGDLDYALGYVHAQERYFEMDLRSEENTSELQS